MKNSECLQAAFKMMPSCHLEKNAFWTIQVFFSWSFLIPNWWQCNQLYLTALHKFSNLRSKLTGLSFLLAIWLPQGQLKKLVSAIFINFLFFNQMIALRKLWKLLFILSTKLFLFLRYSIFFAFPSFPSFSACRPLL